MTERTDVLAVMDPTAREGLETLLALVTDPMLIKLGDDHIAWNSTALAAFVFLRAHGPELLAALTDQSAGEAVAWLSNNGNVISNAKMEEMKAGLFKWAYEMHWTDAQPLYTHPATPVAAVTEDDLWWLLDAANAICGQSGNTSHQDRLTALHRKLVALRNSGEKS